MNKSIKLEVEADNDSLVHFETVIITESKVDVEWNRIIHSIEGHWKTSEVHKRSKPHHGRQWRSAIPRIMLRQGGHADVLTFM